MRQQPPQRRAERGLYTGHNGPSPTRFEELHAVEPARCDAPAVTVARFPGRDLPVLSDFLLYNPPLSFHPAISERTARSSLKYWSASPVRHFILHLAAVERVSERALPGSCALPDSLRKHIKPFK